MLDFNKTHAGVIAFGSWHCGACIGKWSHREHDAYRWLVCGDPDTATYGDKVFCAYIGSTMPKDVGGELPDDEEADARRKAAKKHYDIINGKKAIDEEIRQIR